MEEYGREELEELEEAIIASTAYAPIQEQDASCHVYIHGHSGFRAIVHSRNQQFRI